MVHNPPEPLLVAQICHVKGKMIAAVLSHKFGVAFLYNNK